MDFERVEPAQPQASALCDGRRSLRVCTERRRIKALYSVCGHCAKRMLDAIVTERQVWQHRHYQCPFGTGTHAMENLMRFQRFGIRGHLTKLAAAALSASLASVGAASAHPGHEGPSGVLHFIASPAHAVMLGAAIIGGMALVAAMRRAFVRRSASNGQR